MEQHHQDHKFMFLGFDLAFSVKYTIEDSMWPSTAQDKICIKDYFFP